MEGWGAFNDGTPSFSQRLHVPEFVFHRTPYTAQVDSNHALPLIAPAVGRGGDVRHDAGIVEGSVEPAEFGDGTFYHCFHLRVVADVTADGDDFVTSRD